MFPPAGRHIHFNQGARTMKYLSRALALAVAGLLMASIALAQDAPKEKKKRDPEAFFKALGAKDVDGKLVLKKDDFLASNFAKKAGDEKAGNFWKRIAGDAAATQVDFDTFKKNMPQRGKKGGGGGAGGGGGGGGDSK
jgi:hypothetical protein